MAKLRKLGRPTDHRLAMLRNLVTSFLREGQIETTLTRAKETRRMAEKMISLGKYKTPLFAFSLSFPLSESLEKDTP